MRTNSLLFCLIWVQATIAQDDGPTNFLTVNMANFSTWLKVNNMDPSPIQPDGVCFQGQNAVANLKCCISNYATQGHSRSLVVIRNTTFEFLYQHFVIDFDLAGTTTFFGDYNITGTMNSVKPISSNGTWNITIPKVKLKSFEANLFTNIIQNYMIIRSYNLSEMSIADEGGFEIYFENLLEQPGVIGYEVYVENALFDGFSDHLLSSRQDPLRTLYSNYWNEVFNTPYVCLGDFMNATLPPPTTTIAYTTTTSQLPTTTPNPNECPDTGADFIPHPTSCSKYYLCIEGTAYEQECSDGLHFNPVIKECDFPENINCTKPLPECPPDGVSFHPYPGNCSLYVVCAEGTPLVRHCAEGTCFDPEELKCRINETAASDILKQVLYNRQSHSYKKAIFQCQPQVSQGIILVSSLLTAQEFSVCDNGIYKATFVCPPAHIFDELLQDCRNKNI